MTEQAIKDAPIIEKVTGENGLLSQVWTLWFARLVRRVNQGDGISGTFTTTDAKTITVENGIVVSIV